MPASPLRRHSMLASPVHPGAARGSLALQQPGALPPSPAFVVPVSPPSLTIVHVDMQVPWSAATSSPQWSSSQRASWDARAPRPAKHWQAEGGAHTSRHASLELSLLERALTMPTTADTARSSSATARRPSTVSTGACQQQQERQQPCQGSSVARSDLRGTAAGPAVVGVVVSGTVGSSPRCLRAASRSRRSPRRRDGGRGGPQRPRTPRTSGTAHPRDMKAPCSQRGPLSASHVVEDDKLSSCAVMDENAAQWTADSRPITKDGTLNSETGDGSGTAASARGVTSCILAPGEGYAKVFHQRRRQSLLVPTRPASAAPSQGFTVQKHELRALAMSLEYAQRERQPISATASSEQQLAHEISCLTARITDLCSGRAQEVLGSTECGQNLSQIFCHSFGDSQQALQPDASCRESGVRVVDALAKHSEDVDKGWSPAARARACLQAGFIAARSAQAAANCLPETTGSQSSVYLEEVKPTYYVACERSVGLGTRLRSAPPRSRQSLK